MKRVFYFLVFTFLGIFNAYSQTITENDWEKVVVTRNPEDIKGLTRIGDVSAESSKLYGKQSKLREEATEKIKKAAAKKGASIVLIQVDNFAMTPINNVNMVGVAYGGTNTTPVPPKEEPQAEKVQESNDESVITEKDWEKVIVTRNPDDIKGLKMVGEISAEASKLYGNQSKLRAEATEKIKKEAAKKGAKIVLIQVDNFAMTPINNVNMVGMSYK